MLYKYFQANIIDFQIEKEMLGINVDRISNIDEPESVVHLNPGTPY